MLERCWTSNHQIKRRVDVLGMGWACRGSCWRSPARHAEGPARARATQSLRACATHHAPLQCGTQIDRQRVRDALEYAGGKRAHGALQESVDHLPAQAARQQPGQAGERAVRVGEENTCNISGSRCVQR